MTRDEILQAIRREHLNFLTVIAGIPDAELVDAPITEEWTVKDTMAHLAIWTRIAIKFIREFKRDGVPIHLGLDDAARVDAFNEQGWQARQETPLAEVIQEFHAAFQDLIAAVETLTDQELSAPLPAPWDEGDTLEILIATNSYEHEPEHTLQVDTWRENQDDHEEDD